MNSETKVRYANKVLLKKLEEADQLVARMHWRIERGESMASAFAFDVVSELQALGLPEAAARVQKRYEDAAMVALEGVE